jgi:hypothetical protein
MYVWSISGGGCENWGGGDSMALGLNVMVDSGNEAAAGADVRIGKHGL